MRGRRSSRVSAPAAKRRSAAPVASVLPLAVSLISAAVHPPQPSAQPAAAPQPAHAKTCGIHCGTERWTIKTMSDVGAGEVVLTPVPTSVTGLISAAAPDESSDDTRLNSLEKQVFSVQARLVGYKLEFKGGKGDRDFHIVIQDPNSAETMIVEIPDPECDGVCNSLVREQIEQARHDFLAAFPDNPPSSQFVVVDDPQPVVTVTGVGLFDFFHGQTGVAKNCIELHPILGITFPSPGTFHAKHDPSREPPKTSKDEHQCIPE